MGGLKRYLPANSYLKNGIRFSKEGLSPLRFYNYTCRYQWNADLVSGAADDIVDCIEEEQR